MQSETYSVLAWDYSNTSPSHSMPEARFRINYTNLGQAQQKLGELVSNDPKGHYELLCSLPADHTAASTLRTALTEAQAELASEKNMIASLTSSMQQLQHELNEARAALHTPTGAGTCTEVYRDLHHFERCDLQAGHQGPHSFTAGTAEAN